MPELNRDDCAHVRNLLGVYLLGAIGPGERAQIEEHLAACPWCRGELAGLAGLPGLLRRVPPDVALHAWIDDATGSPPGPPLDKLIARVSAIRFRRRLITVAAGLALAVAAAAGVQAIHSLPASTIAVTTPRWTAIVTGASPATGASATVRYAAEPWGTELEVQISGVPAGTRCELTITNAQGQDITAGGWIITTGKRYAWHPASVPWPTSRLRGFVVTAGSRTLVTVPARQAGTAGAALFKLRRRGDEREPTALAVPEVREAGRWISLSGVASIEV
jgi:Putative zinc-finger